MRAAARSVARIAAVAAGLAAMPALATEIGRACDTPEHCLPQNQLRYYEVLRQAIGQHWQAPASAAADSACTLELTQSPGGKLVSVRTIQPCGRLGRWLNGRPAVPRARRAMPVLAVGRTGRAVAAPRRMLPIQGVRCTFRAPFAAVRTPLTL